MMDAQSMQTIFDAAEDLTTEIDQADSCLRAVLMMIDQSAGTLPDRGAALMAVVSATGLFLQRARRDADRIVRQSIG